MRGNSEITRRRPSSRLARAVAMGTGLGAWLLAGTSVAQIDINPPLPNLLLMIDTSGSMEMMPDGSNPVCAPGTPLLDSDLNRWGAVVDVLTGSIQNLSCYSEDRSTSNFIQEFSKGNAQPYDANYFLPYHRYLSNLCLPTPGQLPSGMGNDIFMWNNNYRDFRLYNDPTFNNPTSCPGAPGPEWVQDTDGLLDTYRDRIRFGLFTFDNHIDPDDGVNGNAIDWSGGFKGLWSYYDNWESGGTPAQGGPPACTPSDFEVGARNYAAPPWEGRMMPFGPSNANLATIHNINDRVQDVILMTRPYGATPLAGMFDDAEVWFHQDNETDKKYGGPIAPYGDQLFRDGCRSSYILLLSDGEPNLDLRPDCALAGGTCPYDQAWEIADRLYNTGDPNLSVKTFVIGFGQSTDPGNTFDCTTLSMPSDLNAGGQCVGATGPLKACCNLAEIAYHGGTGNAYFADNTASLASAVAAIFDQIAAQPTSRTLPVVATALATQSALPTSPAQAVSYEFGSSFAPDSGKLWRGQLERKRWRCIDPGTGIQPVLQTVNDSVGDDFAANLNTGGPARRALTVVAENNGGIIRSLRSVRPNLTADEGLGLHTGTTADGSVSAVSTTSNLALAMGIPTSPLPAFCQTMSAGSNTDCAQKLMTWELGEAVSGLPDRVGDAFGAIYHSTPAIIGRPAAFIRDEAYDFFAQTPVVAQRPLMLYTATVDGQLHAFKVASNDSADAIKADSLANNEVWTFIPPHVLPRLGDQYPNTPTNLLDGAPVVQDIAFERDINNAIQGGTAGGAVWHTVLVAGGYLGGGFYYALDVTDPENPEFLWQLSLDNDDDALFSDFSGQPAIGTVAVDDGSGVKEVGVAFLPGGLGTENTGANCTRGVTNYTHITGSYLPRASVKCWNENESRSITVVRLDTGEVLRRFSAVPNNSGSSQLPSSRHTQYDFDAPILSVVPYPNNTGQVANRAYLSDQDGTLWRMDLSDPDASNWTVDIVFDAYAYPGDTATNGQPVAGMPVLSVDGEGNTIILFGTGDQEDFTSQNVNGRVWSLKELPQPAGSVPFTIEANWVLGDPNVANGAFEAGEKLLGPISVFDGVA
ncbi:MAG: hypothetical protein KC731_14760, partial [Myxococcales bacterium]|nr:hypothetical protein [Myxococcales bacterium]